MNSTEITWLIIIIILVLMSGFFSSAETALSTIGEVKVRSMIEEGRRGAGIVLKVIENYGKMISAILVGNNIVNIVASALATTFAIEVAGSRAVGYATGILTLVILIFGEIVPKSIAKARAEKLAVIYAPVIYGLMVVLTPVIWLVDKIARCIMWIIRVNPDEKNAITEAEIRTYVDAGHQDGIIEQEEKTIINNVFDFSDAVAKEIMIPNVDMVCVDSEASYEEVKDTFRDGMYTRLPVFHDRRDNIIGLINIKDFIFVEDESTFRVENIMREGYFTHEYKKTADLLVELRREAAPMAFVLSEYGDCVGMITMEDLLEEIVGEIRDEFDSEELEAIKQVGDNTYIIEGNQKLDDVNDAIGTELDSEVYDSLAGLCMEHLDRIPVKGDEIVLDNGTRMRVIGVDKNRITKVKLVTPKLLQNTEEASESE